MNQNDRLMKKINFGKRLVTIDLQLITKLRVNCRSTRPIVYQIGSRSPIAYRPSESIVYRFRSRLAIDRVNCSPTEPIVYQIGRRSSVKSGPIDPPTIFIGETNEEERER